MYIQPHRRFSTPIKRSRFHPSYTHNIGVRAARIENRIKATAELFDKGHIDRRMIHEANQYIESGSWEVPQEQHRPRGTMWRIRRKVTEARRSLETENLRNYTEGEIGKEVRGTIIGLETRAQMLRMK